jgi:multiple sugar transport system ATP-binding protein
MTLADKIVVLRDGRVEQVGSPMELYNNPANKFVAGFLGSPAMNFLKKAPLNIPPNGTLGIRPEHLRPAPGGRIKGTVTYVERLGGDTNLLVSTDEQEPLTVRIFGQDGTQVGEKIELDFDDQASFAFDHEHRRIAVAA